MDNGLLTEGRINPNLGQINELISPAQNYYNSFFVQLQRRMSSVAFLAISYTFAKSIMLDGMDFNNQFDFSNTMLPRCSTSGTGLALPPSTSPGLKDLPVRTLHARCFPAGG
jgi:hypothetical protein